MRQAVILGVALMAAGTLGVVAGVASGNTGGVVAGLGVVAFGDGVLLPCVLIWIAD